MNGTIRCIIVEHDGDVGLIIMEPNSQRQIDKTLKFNDPRRAMEAADVLIEAHYPHTCGHECGEWEQIK